MTTIVIGLAAVVVLILVVVLLALRYLRADDGDDFEDMPAERPQPRVSADDRDRRTVGRKPARSAWPPQAADDAEPRRTGRGGGAGGQRPARDHDRPARAGARDSSRELAGTRSSQRAAAKDNRHGGEAASNRHQDSLPAVRPRAKRAEGDGDWPSTKWEELSDVDYWAEVASDKPLTTTAQPAAQARPARPVQARAPESRQPQPQPQGQPQGQSQSQGHGQGSRAAAASGRNAVPRLPVRSPRQPAAAGLPATAAPAGFIPAPQAAVRAQPPSAPRPAARPASDPSLAALGRRDGLPPAAAPPPMVSDDDPLTSPSFPRVPAADSRSYGGRGDTPPSGSRSPAPYAATQQLPTYRSASGQFNGYDAAPARQPSPPARPAAPANGFGQPGRTAAGYASPQPYRPAPPSDAGGYGGPAEWTGPPASPGGYPAGYLPSADSGLPASASAQSAPSGNPYGSYVSSPPTSHVSSPPSSYPPSSPAGPPDIGRPPDIGPAGYGAHPADPGARQDSFYSQPAAPAGAAAGPGAASGGWYPEVAAPAGPPAAAMPAASYLDVTRQLPSTGVPAPGYRNGSGYADRAGYPAAQHEAAGYLPPVYPAAPQEPAGYPGPDTYGQDPYGRDPYGRDREPYGGYPGYGAADGQI